MKKVTRILGLCALMALVTVSCKKNENTKGGVSFLASITQPTGDAKTHIGEGNFLMWDEGNAIKVYNTAGDAEEFTTSQKNVTEAEFTGDITETETYYACYPKGNTIDIANATATLTLSAAQQYVAEGGFANDVYPMVATNAGKKFNFRSPFGVLCLQLKGTATVGSIELTDANFGLAGDFTVALADMTAIATSSTTSNTITLSYDEGVALDAATAKNFYMVVPAGAFAQGFTAVVKDMAGNTIHTLATTADNTLQAEHILTMPEVTVQYAAPTVTTNDATNLAQTTATINGAATAPAGTALTECGFYYGTSADALTNSVTATTASPFSYDLTGLNANTTYYFKAYAKNEIGENYGEVKNFTTKKVPVEGRFKVAADRFVEFAPGNLYINEDTHIGAFESHCYDTHTYPEYDPSSNCWGLPMLSTDDAYKMDGSKMYFGMGRVDIANGWEYSQYWPFTTGNPVDWAESLANNTEGWYTMPKEEAEYLFENHTCMYCFVDFGTGVGVKKGLVIMPYGWEGSLTESIDNATWQALEADHAAFLPAMGVRNWVGYGPGVTYFVDDAPVMYWTGTITLAVPGDGGHAAGGYSFGCYRGDATTTVNAANGDIGMSVRLVKPYVSK